MSADTTHEPSHGDDLLLGDNILEVLASFPQMHPLDSLSDFSGGLEVSPQVETTSFHG